MKKYFLILALFLPYKLDAQEVLKILSPHWEGIKYETASGFEKFMKREFNKDVVIEWLDAGGGTSEILRFVESEYKRSPSGIGVDVIFGGGTEPFQALDEKNLFEPNNLSESLLSEIPSTLSGSPLRSTKGTWIAPMVASFGLLCNQKVLSFLKIPSPTSWEALTNPKLATWIGASDPRRSGSMHAALEVLLQGFGWEKGWNYILRFASNVRNFSGASSITTMQVASGDVACTLAVDSQAWNQIKLDPKKQITYTLPSEFTLINGDGAAILKGTKQKDLAQKFIEFLLSPEGQKILILPPDSDGGPQKHFINRLVVRKELYSEYKDILQNMVNPFERTNDFQYDSTKASLRWSITNELFRVFMMDASRRYSPEKLLSLQALIPTEEETLKIAQSTEWKDPVKRFGLVQEWRKKIKEFAEGN